MTGKNKIPLKVGGFHCQKSSRKNKNRKEKKTHFDVTNVYSRYTSYQYYTVAAKNVVLKFFGFPVHKVPVVYLHILN